MTSPQQRQSYRDHATLLDFRDTEIMVRLAEESNGSGKGVTTAQLADALGFEPDGDRRPVGIRLAWMRRYGMVAFSETDRAWRLSPGGRRVIQAQERAAEIAVVDQLPDETMVEVMAHVTSRYRHGQAMLAHLLRREFLFGTQGRRS